MKPDGDGEVVKEAEKGTLGPEPGKAPVTQAQVSSGSEPRVPEKMLPKRPRKTRIEGSERLSCKRCDHFLGELKAEGSWQYLTNCHRCKTENSFGHQLK